MQDHNYFYSKQKDKIQPTEKKKPRVLFAKEISDQTMAVIRNVASYVKNENGKRSFHEKVDVLSIVAEMTGISRSTIGRICSAKNRSEKAKKEKRKRSSNAFKKLDAFDMNLIRRTMHQFFKQQKLVTMRSLAVHLKKEASFPYSHVTLWKIIKKIGFKYRKRGNRLFVYQRSEVMFWRKDYLSKIKQFRSEGRPIFYQDETWVNQGYTTPKAWYDTTVEENPHAALQPSSNVSLGYKDPIGKGQRLIISAVGGDDGFIQVANEVFTSKNDGDYHKEMNSAHFEEWVVQKLIPKLPKNAVLVMDNAPYHSRRKVKVPTSSSKKCEMIKWLNEHKIAVEENKPTKSILYKKYILPNKSKYLQFAVDELMNEQGYKILRLPPYHCELNPIELIWAQLKGNVAKRNTTFKLSNVKTLVLEEFAKITSEHWKSAINHVIKIEDKYSSELHDLNVNFVKPLIISLESESDDEC